MSDWLSKKQLMANLGIASTAFYTAYANGKIERLELSPKCVRWRVIDALATRKTKTV